MNNSIQLEEENMATSSIFADFSIRDKNTAQAFAKALEASAKTAAQPAIAPPCDVLKTPEEIDQFFGNKKQKHKK